MPQRKKAVQDYQLDHGMFNTPANIDFFARKIASMHKDLNLSPLHFGVPSRILAKLVLNISLFTKALREITDKVEKYEEIENVLKVAYKKYERLFEQRCMSGYIKRCHGDLKATNLWLCPVIPTFSPWKRLLALDCI